MSRIDPGSPRSPISLRRRLWRYAGRLRCAGAGEGWRAAAGVMILLALAAHALWDLPAIALQHMDVTAERALQAFAVARGINAVISVIQDVEIGFTLGLAATMSPGEVLDPVNDLIERFSLVMLVSSALFWTLRLVAGLLFEQGLLWFVAGLYLGGLLLSSARGALPKLAGDLGIRLSAVFLVLLAYSFLTPLAIGFVHGTDVVSVEYQAAAAEIEDAREKLEAMNTEMGVAAEGGGGDEDTDEDEDCIGVADCLETFGETVSELSRAIGTYSDVDGRFQGYIEESVELADRISRQIIVQIAVFVIEALLIPLAGLWVAGLAIRRLTGI